MKLIIKQYLASLKERNELDAMLPDLLSEMGLTVFARPKRGPREYGVDIGAVGRLEDGNEKVYLLSVKSGDLTRKDWDSDSPQALRPSLNEITDFYIPTLLPKEHLGKPIVICLCFGGDIQGTVRPLVEAYTSKNATDSITFEEWNGDRLAGYIQSNFLREELLTSDAKSQLRKSLALLDSPEVSFRHFASLVDFLTAETNNDDKKTLQALRQLNIALWILFTWARDEGNLEAAYTSAEYALLHGWEISKTYIKKKTKTAKSIQSAYETLLNAYWHISTQYMEKLKPLVSKLHGISRGGPQRLNSRGARIRCKAGVNRRPILHPSDCSGRTDQSISQRV